MKLFPEDERLQQWLRFAAKEIAFQGLPARICWLGYRERDKAGLLFNKMVRDGELSAPIVIGRDHLDAGSVASPYRETEAMLDGSDAVSDWALLNFATGIASGAAWMSFHHGGGVGMGYSQHAGLVAVADGSDEAERAAAPLPDQRSCARRDTPCRRRLCKGARSGARSRSRHAKPPMNADFLIAGISQLATATGTGPKYGTQMRDVSVIENAAIAMQRRAISYGLGARRSGAEQHPAQSISADEPWFLV